MTQSLTVLNTTVRMHDGLYSLNDLHRAAGGEKRHQPNNWLRIDQTSELIKEIENSSDPRSKAVITREGRNGGTYACKELVYAYAMWISARFHLAVIRAFDAMVNGALPDKQTITREQAGELATLVAERAGESGKPRAYYWSRFNNHFRIARYRDLPASRFDEAVQYLKTMPDENGQPPLPAGFGAADMTVLMTMKGGRVTRMQPVNDMGEGQDDAGFCVVPAGDLDTLTRLALACAELLDGLETLTPNLRDTAKRMRKRLH